MKIRKQMHDHNRKTNSGHGRDGFCSQLMCSHLVIVKMALKSKTLV